MNEQEGGNKHTLWVTISFRFSWKVVGHDRLLRTLDAAVADGHDLIVWTSL